MRSQCGKGVDVEKSGRVVQLRVRGGERGADEREEKKEVPVTKAEVRKKTQALWKRITAKNAGSSSQSGYCGGVDIVPTEQYHMTALEGRSYPESHTAHAFL